MKWQPIDTAPKDESDFFCTNGVLVGVGSYSRYYYSDKIIDSSKRDKFRKDFDDSFGKAPFDGVVLRVEFKGNRTVTKMVEPQESYIDWWGRKEKEWEKIKHLQPPIEWHPNPKAGQIKSEYFYAWATYSYDPEEPTEDYDGAIGFTPTHWAPIPENIKK